MRAAVLLLAAGLAGCGETPAAPAAPDAGAPGRVTGGFLRDAEGRALLLRGANVSSRHKQPPYFDFHQAPDYARLRDAWGMNSVRFLISWAAIEPASGQYDDAYLDAVAERVEWMHAAGLSVVLDMHQDVYGEGFGGNGAPRWTCDEAEYAAYEPISPWYLNYLNEHVTRCYDRFWASAELRSHYVEAWRRVAARLAGDPGTIVGFDVMNEPYWGSTPMLIFEAEVLEPFYVEVVAAVRAEAPAWVAFLEPASSRNLGVATGLVKFPFADVVYAPHSYDRDAEGGSGFDPAHRDAIIDNLAALATEARSLEAALWIGEYGGVASAPGITAYMDAQYDGAAAVTAGAMYWDYGRDDGYAMLASDGSEKAELLDVLVRPWPERVAGDPVSIAYDEAASRLEVTYRPDRQSAAPTEIAVPERRYPGGGYTVECGGCSTERAPGLLRVLTAPPGEVATVIVEP